MELGDHIEQVFLILFLNPSEVMKLTLALVLCLGAATVAHKKGMKEKHPMVSLVRRISSLRRKTRQYIQQYIFVERILRILWAPYLHFFES